MVLQAGETSQLRTLAFCLNALQKRLGPEFAVHDGKNEVKSVSASSSPSETVRARFERLYHEAIGCKLWWVVRYCAVKMRKCQDSLAPSVTTILVRGKRVRVVNKPITKLS